jgi:hypothetical protein
MLSNNSDQGENLEIVNDDVGADIAASIEKLKDEAPVEDVAPEPAEPAEAPAEEQPQTPVIAPPQAYSAKVKESWAKLPPDIQAELVKREEDMHKMVTRQDGELNLGREIKEVIQPYQAMITAEGGTPVTAVRDLLNTAYVLRKGTPSEKADIVRTVCKQFDVDVAALTQEQEYVDPTISELQKQNAELQSQLENIKQTVNPDILFNQLRERQERSILEKEAAAFATNPENKYFDKVKPFMASFLGEGLAKDFKQAYDMACNAHPEVRSILEAEKKAAETEKRKSEIKAKQNAASSISGSPATAVSNAKSPDTDDIESSVRQAIRSASGNV